jgi:hypothetical protein
MAAISIGAGMLLRKKSSAGSMDQQADQPTNQTIRGGFVPVVMGRRRVGTVFLWTGDRTEVEEVVGQSPSGGKGGGGGGGDIKQLVYLERGWVGLCCQRCLIVNGIYKDGRLVDNSRFAKPFMPSGSRIDFGKDGSGFMFWGTDHPALDNEAMVLLNDLTGIQSNWEGMAWIYWDRLRLGPVARWGNMEYDITTAPPSGLIGFTAASQIGTDPETGWNPALCILLLLMEEAPVGCAMPNCRVDFLSFNAVGAALVTEGLSANILIQDGQTADNVIGGILEDIGAMLYEVNGKIGIRLVRKVNSPIDIDDSVMLPPYEEIDRFHRITQADQVVFTYSNLNRDFAGDIVNIEDDGASDNGTRRRQRRVALTIATNEEVAWKIANRRIQENFAPFAKYGIKFIRDFKAMLPGEVVRHPILGDLRLIETRFDATTPTTDALFVQDVYGQAANYTDPDDGSVGGGTTEPPLPDLLFRMFESPRLSLMRGNYTGTLSVYAMLRIRRRNSVSRSTLFRGQNSLELLQVTSTTKRQFGGFLAKAFSDDSPYSGDGIVIDIFGSGFDDLTDADKRKHALDIAAWIPVTSPSAIYSGGITVVIGQNGSEEICYATIIQPEATATIDSKTLLVVKWRIKGLIRSRMTTKIRRHEAGVAVFVFQSSSLNQSPLTVTGTIAPNLLAYHKDRTANANGQQITLSASSNSTISVQGKWYKAIPIQFMWIGEKIPNYSLSITTQFNPSYAANYPDRRPCRRLSSYSVQQYGADGSFGTYGVVRSAICWDMTYPSATYLRGAGGTAYADGAGGFTAGAGGGEETKDRFVLEVCFHPWDAGLATPARAINPTIIRQQTVADASSTDINGSGRNHARYIGTVSIDYSALMHEQDRLAVRALLDLDGGLGGNLAVNRLVAATGADADFSLGAESNPFIGDRGAEEGNRPIFYLRVAHYLLNAPNGIADSVRYYYSYDLDLRFENRLPIHSPNEVGGWHYSDYAVSGVNGELF